MAENQHACEMYFTFSIVNFIEAILGMTLSMIVTPWTLFALLGHILSLSVSFASGLISWFYFKVGTTVPESGENFGPEKWAIDRWILAVNVQKWWALIGNWIPIVFFMIDTSIDQAAPTWYNISGSSNTETKQTVRAIIAGSKTTVFVTQLHFIASNEKSFQKWTRNAL